MSMAERIKKLKEENPTKFGNAGKSWKQDEIMKLLSEVQEKMSHEQMAEAHGRTVGSISSKLNTIAADYYLNNKLSIYEIGRHTGLSAEVIRDAISKRQYEMSKKSSASASSASSPPSEAKEAKEKEKEREAEPLKSITRDDFYNTIRDLLATAKDIQRMMKDFHTDTFVSK